MCLINSINETLTKARANLTHAFVGSNRYCLFVISHLIASSNIPVAVPGNSQRILNVLHNTEEPASVFAILEGGAKQPVLVADTLLDALLPKMAVLYTSNKKQTRIESKGNRYEMGDFVVKLGSVTMSGSFKGILVEVRSKEVLS